MEETGYRTANVKDLTRTDGWAPIRRELGIRSFGTNAWTTANIGGELIVEHVELTQEELYVVIEGHATFTVDGRVIDGPAGTLVVVSDPALTRSAIAAAPQTVVLTVGAEPGAAFHPHSWEINRDVLPLFEAGRYDEARALLVAALDEYADPCYLLYNLACADTQLGDLDTAIDFLARAVELRAELGPLAAEDMDLMPLRDHPRFAGLSDPPVDGPG
jgi:tetratricopeptide (TPR) repeat protein